MFELLIPLVMGEARQTHVTVFANAAECGAYLQELRQRVVDLRIWRYYPGEPLAYDLVDQPNGVDAAWAYETPTVGVCVPTPTPHRTEN